ncbi:MAG TPA: aminotransferase class V-fold PLP-dependent enzyme [Gaiellaceae bacterium]
MTFAEARAQFPVLERFAYLNAGSMGPLSRASAEAFAGQAALDVERGRGGKPYFEQMLALRQGVRERIARLLRTEPDRIALTMSTTDSVHVVLAGLRLRPDDEVVTTDSEHPGLLLSLHASGARIVVAELHGRPAAEARERILERVGERTRLLALSHVLWTTGHVLPVAELKEQTGLPVLVDGAQSAGAIPIEPGALDFYTVSAQKWLCGPDSLGALYVAEPDALPVGLPTAFGPQSFERDGRFVPRQGAQRFDSGWLAVPSLAGLAAALDGAPEWRFERAAEAAERCRLALAERFEVVTEPAQGTLVSFRPAGDPAKQVAKAYERGVVIRDLPGTGLLRASCGYWTSDEDIARLVAAVD